MNAHYIVTNSYSCGIGEQNRNALMMGNDENIVRYAERYFYNRRNQST